MHRALRPGALRLHQCRNNSTNATSNARLAFEFHGLEIPSREKLLSQQSDSAAANPPQLLSTTSRLELVEQRRAARLARETVAGPKTDSTRAGRPDRRQKTSAAAVRPKRVPNANRFQGLDALGQFTPFTSAKNAVRDKRRRELRKDSSDAPRRGRPGDRGKRFAAVKSSSTVPQSGNINDTQEPSLESLEEGGEEPMKARLTVPENPSVDLSDILGRIRSTIGVVPALRRNGAPVFSPVRDRSQYIMEAVGGDYARYSPHVTQDYLTSPKELGAIKQAHITLSKNKDVDLNQRELLFRIVTTSTLSSNKQIARA